MSEQRVVQLTLTLAESEFLSSVLLMAAGFATALDAAVQVAKITSTAEGQAMVGELRRRLAILFGPEGAR